MKLDPKKWYDIFNEFKEGEKITRKGLAKKYELTEMDARAVCYILDNYKLLGQQLSGKKVVRRIFVGGDLHCGHLAGLTPESWQVNGDRPKMQAYAEYQRESWLWFRNQIERLKPFDRAIWNGDLIDGRGEKSGSTELVTSDREEQTDIAIHVIRQVGAKKNAITLGTPYHTGNHEDWEYRIAEHVPESVSQDEVNLDIDGLIINAKHHTGSSSVPHGEATALLKDALWADLWADFEERPKANIILRSHVHKFIRVEDRNRVAMKLPALQGAMTKYGNRRCVSLVDFGFVHVDMYDDGTWKDFIHLYRPESQKNEVIEF